MPCIYWVPEKDETAVRQVDVALNATNSRCKAAKLSRRLVVDRDGEFGVDASVGFLLDETSEVSAGQLESYMAIAKYGYQMFLDHLDALRAKPDAAVLEPSEREAGVAIH